jgi:CRISPR-associated protein Csb2
VVGLRIRFDLGRYHANPWGSNVNDAVVEWPPSPWRLLRGLYAVGRTHAGLVPRQAALDRALVTLAAAPPPLFELPAATPAHTRHYMPVPEGKSEKSAKVLDGFLAIDPQAELVAWWEARLDADASDALATAARCLGYLGRSESVCTAQLEVGVEPEKVAAAPLEGTAIDPNPDNETIDLLCPATDDPLAALTVSVTELRKQKRLIPPGTRRVTYAVSRAPSPHRSIAGTPEPLPMTRPSVALFRIRGGNRPALTDAVSMGQLLRKALQSQFGSRNKKASSSTFSGRAGDRRRTDQHRHAHYLSLPDRHGRRIDRLFVWAPEGFGEEEVAALAGLRTIFERDPAGGPPREFSVALGALGDTADLHLPALLGPSREWESLTPFGLVRHPKIKRGTEVDSPKDQVRRELEHRGGLPDPTSIKEVQGDWHRFRSSKAGTSRLGRATVVGIRIQFDEVVRGPIAIGALSHYGLGLMVPANPA